MSEPAIGHNSNLNKVEKANLKTYIERVERLEEEKKATADDIRSVYAEAKGSGFDVKALRTIVRLRKQDADKRREQEAIVETYLHALGMLAGTPLGDAAVARDHPNTSNPPFNAADDAAKVPA